MNDANIFGPAMLGVTSGIQSFLTLMPKITDIRAANPSENPGIAADVRLAEVAGVTLTLGVGVIASSLTGSPVPAFTSLLMSVILVTIYESTLRADRPFEAIRPNLRVVDNGA